jgi:hypothetical protein
MKILLTLIAYTSIFLNLCLIEFFERKNFNHRDFNAFVENCNEIDDFVVDSIAFDKIIKNNPFPQISSSQLKFVKTNTITKYCDHKLRYNIYVVGKIKSSKNQNNLIYYLNLNPHCSYDGIENIFILCSYDNRGKLLSEQIIGKYYQVFGEKEIIYFRIFDSTKIELRKHREFESETNEIITYSSKEVYSF